MQLELNNGKSIDLYSRNLEEMRQFAIQLKNENTNIETCKSIYADIYNHNVYTAVIFKKAMSDNEIDFDCPL